MMGGKKTSIKKMQGYEKSGNLLHEIRGGRSKVQVSGSVMKELR